MQGMTDIKKNPLLIYPKMVRYSMLRNFCMSVKQHLDKKCLLSNQWWHINVLQNLSFHQMMFHTVLCPYLWKGFVEMSCMPVSTCGTCESGLEVVGAAEAGL